MNADKYVLTVRNKRGVLLQRKEFAFNADERVLLKVTMRTIAYQQSESVVIRGYRVAGKYYDLQWYAINPKKGRVCLETRETVAKRRNTCASLIRDRLQEFRGEDERIDRRAEEEYVPIEKQGIYRNG